MPTSIATTIDHSTLESVQQAFNHWRSHRGQDKKIPEYLWKQVSQILPYYQQQKILSALSISHRQLHKNLNLIPQYRPLTKPVADKQPVDGPPSLFVKTMLPAPAPMLQDYQVEWQRPDGAKLIINHLDAAALNLLMQRWEG